MSELDRLRAENRELREDLDAHEAKDDERYEEIREHLGYIRAALDFLVKAEKDELS